MVYHKLPWFIDISRYKGQSLEDEILYEREKPLNLPSIQMFELDDQLVNTIAKALSYDADDRFQSADEFINALDGKISVDRPTQKRRILSSENRSTPLYSETGQNKRSSRGFAAVAGMEELKQQLLDDIIDPLYNPEEYRRYGVSIPNGMLLYGPPGCGKTFFAKCFAEEVGFNFMLITPATLKSRYVNATQENIAAMFKEAAEQAPTIIFIDEFNELVPNRESDVHEMSRSAVNEMLAQMDRTGEKGIFVIGATNYPHMIDPAILRSGRLDRKYYVGVPDFESRVALFKLYLENRPCDLDVDYDELARLTDNYVSSDIQVIINDASRVAVKLRCKITMGLLKDAIAKTKPSLTAEERRRYEQIRDDFNKGDNNNSSRPRIGFRP